MTSRKVIILYSCFIIFINMSTVLRRNNPWCDRSCISGVLTAQLITWCLFDFSTWRLFFRRMNCKRTKINGNHKLQKKKKKIQRRRFDRIGKKNVKYIFLGRFHHYIYSNKKTFERYDTVSIFIRVVQYVLNIRVITV